MEITAETIIAAYEETGLNPCCVTTIKTNSEEKIIGACAIGVFYSYMNGLKFGDSVRSSVVSKNAHGLVDSILKGEETSPPVVSGFFGLGFDAAFSAYNSFSDFTTNTRHSDSTKEIFSSGYDVGVKVKEHFEKKAQTPESNFTCDKKELVLSHV